MATVLPAQQEPKSQLGVNIARMLEAYFAEQRERQFRLDLLDKQIAANANATNVNKAKFLQTTSDITSATLSAFRDSYDKRRWKADVAAGKVLEVEGDTSTLPQMRNQANQYTIDTPGGKVSYSGDTLMSEWQAKGGTYDEKNDLLIDQESLNKRKDIERINAQIASYNEQRKKYYRENKIAQSIIDAEEKIGKAHAASIIYDKSYSDMTKDERLSFDGFWGANKDVYSFMYAPERKEARQRMFFSTLVDNRRQQANPYAVFEDSTGETKELTTKDSQGLATTAGWLYDQVAKEALKTGDFYMIPNIEQAVSQAISMEKYGNLYPVELVSTGKLQSTATGDRLIVSAIALARGGVDDKPLTDDVRDTLGKAFTDFTANVPINSMDSYEKASALDGVKRSLSNWFIAMDDAKSIGLSEKLAISALGLSYIVGAGREERGKAFREWRADVADLAPDDSAIRDFVQKSKFYANKFSASINKFMGGMIESSNQSYMEALNFPKIESAQTGSVLESVTKPIVNLYNNYFGNKTIAKELPERESADRESIGSIIDAYFQENNRYIPPDELEAAIKSVSDRDFTELLANYREFYNVDKR